MLGSVSITRVARPVGVAEPRAQSCTTQTVQMPQPIGTASFSRCTNMQKLAWSGPGRGRRPGSRPGSAPPRPARPRCGRPGSTGIALCGTWIARSPRCARPTRRRRAGRRRRRSAPGRSRPTASIAAREGLRRRLRPRDLARVDVAVDQVVDAVALGRSPRATSRGQIVLESTPTLSPSARSASQQRADLGVGRRCAAPRTRSRPSSRSGSWSSPASANRSATVALCWWSRLLPQIDVAGGVQPLRVGVGGRARGRSRPPGPAPATPRGSRRRASGSGCRPSRR